jgi:asparagine synthase (glutamine-hydrolysing)
MSDASGRFWITFNGEIYNYTDLRSQLEGNGHRFRTASDTEVILEAYRAWGEDCLSRLNGMFAFGLYDTETRRLFMARDRAGEKPLFYRKAPGHFVFASELKALMANPSFPRELDLESLNYCLTYGYVPGERCIFNETRKLEPGHAATYDVEDDRLHIWRYWQLPEPNIREEAPVDELLNRLGVLLEDSVRHQLVSDVPIGILLSGGIDSSLVTAMAARVSSKAVKTFTISFPGHDSYDEGPYARLVANHFGTEHTELAAEPASVELLPELARQYDEPIADSAMVPTFLVSRLVRQHATVALGGDGGDELFGGYPHYGWVAQLERMRRFIPGPIRRFAGAIAAKSFPVGWPGRNHIIGFSSDRRHTIAHVNLYFDKWSRDRLVSEEVRRRFASKQSPEQYKVDLCAMSHSPLRQMTEADFRTYLADQLLVKVDRASMLVSLEVRAPWLDYRIVEFAFGCVPDPLKWTGKERKILPKVLAKRLLPGNFDLKRKQGFTMPLASWFKGEWGSYMESVLQGADSLLFDPSVIRELIASQRRGNNNFQRLFLLTMFELWRREYRVTVPNR